MRKTRPSLKTILFDFDGVLSKGRFYSTLANNHLEIHSRVIENIFSKNASVIIQQWMRGGASFEDVHRAISEKVGAPVEQLNQSLIESVLSMELNPDMLAFASEMRDKGITVAIFTDNMDVFERILVPYRDLASKFNYAFSSSSHKKLKLDNDAAFLRDVIVATGQRPDETLFIDDSPKIGVYMKERGGHFYLYKDYAHGYPAFRQHINMDFDI